MEMFAVATFTLVAGMVDDLRSRKIHNALVLPLLIFVFAANFYFRGFEGFLIGCGSMLLALVATIPLFAFGILGGGDVKLFAAFALAVDPISMGYTLIYSFVWGAIFGLTRAALQRQLMMLVRNTYKIARRQRVEAPQLQKIPYSFAMLLGWFTQLTLMRAGGLI